MTDLVVIQDGFILDDDYGGVDTSTCECQLVNFYFDLNLKKFVIHVEDGEVYFISSHDNCNRKHYLSQNRIYKFYYRLYDRFMNDPNDETDHRYECIEYYLYAYDSTETGKYLYMSIEHVFKDANIVYKHNTDCILYTVKNEKTIWLSQPKDIPIVSDNQIFADNPILFGKYFCFGNSIDE